MKQGDSYMAKRMTCVLLALALLAPSGAKAADNFFQFNDVFSSSGNQSSPSGPSPWLTAEIKDVTPGTVNLTITTSGLQGSEFISDFYLNLDPNINPSSLTFGTPTKTGSFTIMGAT